MRLLLSLSTNPDALILISLRPQFYSCFSILVPSGVLWDTGKVVPTLISAFLLELKYDFAFNK